MSRKTTTCARRDDSTRVWRRTPAAANGEWPVSRDRSIERPHRGASRLRPGRRSTRAPPALRIAYPVGITPLARRRACTQAHPCRDGSSEARKGTLIIRRRPLSRQNHSAGNVTQDQPVSSAHCRGRRRLGAAARDETGRGARTRAATIHRPFGSIQSTASTVRGVLLPIVDARPVLARASVGISCTQPSS